MHQFEDRRVAQPARLEAAPRVAGAAQLHQQPVVPLQQARRARALDVEQPPDRAEHVLVVGPPQPGEESHRAS